jgi:hypothetical protein
MCRQLLNITRVASGETQLTPTSYGTCTIAIYIPILYQVLYIYVQYPYEFLKPLLYFKLYFASYFLSESSYTPHIWNVFITIYWYGGM